VSKISRRASVRSCGARSAPRDRSEQEQKRAQNRKKRGPAAGPANLRRGCHPSASLFLSCCPPSPTLPPVTGVKGGALSQLPSGGRAGTKAGSNKPEGTTGRPAARERHTDTGQSTGRRQAPPAAQKPGCQQQFSARQPKKSPQSGTSRERWGYPPPPTTPVPPPRQRTPRAAGRSSPPSALLPLPSPPLLYLV